MAKKARCLIFAALLFVGFFISIPTILSTEWAKNYWVIPLIEKSTGGKVEVDKIYFSWFGKQRAKNFNWEDGHQSQVKFDSLVIHTPIHRLFFTDNWIPSIQTENLLVSLPHLKTDHVSQKVMNLSLSELVGPVVNLKVTQEAKEVHIVASSDYGLADVFVEQTDNAPVFSKKGTLTYSMPAELYDKLKEQELITLDSSLEVTLLEGESYKFHINPTRLKVRDDIVISHFMGIVTLGSDLQSLEIDLSGTLTDKGGDSDVAIEGKVSLENSNEYDLLLEGKRIRPSLISYVIHDENKTFKTLAKSVLGSHINGSLRLTSHNYEKSGYLQLSSDRAEIPGAYFSWDQDEVSLTRPVNIDIHYVPHNDLNAILPQNLPLTLQLNVCSIKLLDKITPDDIKIQGMISVKDMQLNQLPGVNQCHFTNGLLTASGSSLRNLHISLIGRLSQFDQNMALSRSLGNELRFDLVSELEFNDDFIPMVKEIKASGEDGGLLLNLVGNSLKEKPSELVFSGNINYFMTPELFAKIQDTKDSNYRLISPAILQFLLDEATIDLQNLSLSKMSSKGNLLIDEITVAANQSESIASLRKVTIPWNANALRDEMTLSVTAVTANQSLELKGKLEGHVKINHWTDKAVNWNVNAETSLSSFPVAIISAFTGIDELDVMIGQNLNGEIKVYDDQDGKNGHVAFAVEGDQFDISGSLKAGNYLTLEDPMRPVIVNWDMTPKRFKALRRQLLHQNPELIDQLRLHQSTSLTAEISNLQIPLSKPSHTAATLDLSSGEIYVLDTLTDEMVFFNGINARVASHDLTESIGIHFDAEGQIYNQQNDELKLSFHSLIQNIFDKNGSFNKKGASFEVQATAREAPVVFLCNFLCLDESVLNQIDALIGPRLNAEMNVNLSEMTGPIQVVMNGTTGRLSLDGYLSEGNLTLQSPLSAEFSITPSLQNSILDEILPFLNSAYSSDQPITITIDPNGFFYPLWSNNPYQFSVGAMKIDLGKMYFKNDFQIAQVLSILKYSTERDLISIWFTPLYLSYHNGLVSIRRMDMLVADRYPIAVWGKVNFNEDNINMKIGLGGQTLRTAFGLKGVPKDYYLQLTMKGSISDPSINSNKASTKIAAFIAQLRGGPQGVIVGGIMDLIGGTMGQKATPKPTTKPFPWEVIPVHKNKLHL